MISHQADPAPLLEVRNVSKRFGRIEALRNVSFSVGNAEVLALLGDNGAGKSTLIKIVSGVHLPDAGGILWKGRPVQLRSPQDAYELGIATVYQDLAVVDLMSIYRNMFLGREDLITRRVGLMRWLDHGLGKRRAVQALRDMGIDIHSADQPVGELSGGERQSVAIARAVQFSAKMLILDEPTSALSLKQAAKVLRTIDEARGKGLSLVLISHNVHHVYPVADRFVILSHGEAIAELRRGECTTEEISDLIVQGRRLARELDGR